MKFVCDVDRLGKALACVQGCLPNATTIPILQHIMIAAADRSITVRATDLLNEASAFLPGDVVEPGSATLHGPTLVALCKRLPRGGQVELAKRDSVVNIAFAAGRQRLRSLDPKDFPERWSSRDGEDGAEGNDAAGSPADCVAFRLPSATARNLLAHALIATTTGHPKPHGRGVCLRIEGQSLVGVGLDDHRLARFEAPMPTGAAAMPSVLLPIHAVREILRLLDLGGDEVGLEIDARSFCLSWDGGALRGRLLDAEYPDYHHVIPQDGPPEILVRPYALAEAIGRACVVYASDALNKFGPLIEMSGSADRMKIAAGRYDMAVEQIDCAVSGDVGPITVNSKYVLDALATFPEKEDARILLPPSLSKPIRLLSNAAPSLLHLVMPQKLPLQQVRSAVEIAAPATS